MLPRSCGRGFLPYPLGRKDFYLMLSKSGLGLLFYFLYREIKTAPKAVKTV